MIRLVGKQIALGLLVVLTAITLTFAVVRLSGDPTSLILPQDATPEQRDALRHSLGLDQPVLEQYLHYLGGATHGDFGDSYFDGDSVTAVIMRRLPNTVTCWRAPHCCWPWCSRYRSACWRRSGRAVCWTVWCRWSA